MLRQARVRVMGHLNYYAITDNTRLCNRYVHHAQSILFQMAQPQESAQGIQLGRF